MANSYPSLGVPPRQSLGIAWDSGLNFAVLYYVVCFAPTELEALRSCSAVPWLSVGSCCCCFGSSYRRPVSLLSGTSDLRRQVGLLCEV